MKNKRPQIEPEVAEMVQNHANIYHDGNFTKAINQIVREFVFPIDLMDKYYKPESKPTKGN